MNSKGQFHAGFMTYALLAVIVFIGIFIFAPTLAESILKAIAALANAAQGHA